MSKLGHILGAFGAWFERQKRVLPWRDEPSPYRVWISEIMLQQTQVATVVPYFEKFIARFPDVERLARAPLDDVMLHWAGLGYYSRARNIHRAAGLIVEKGRFPATREEWEALPGVGPYTAGAILSIAQDRIEAILDGNVERVVTRLRRLGRGVQGDAAYKARLWRFSRALVEQGARAGVKPSVLNQALMELGATVCTPKSPKCAVCPLTSMCRAFAEGDAPAFPAPKATREWKEVREKVHCWLDPKGRMLLRKREAGEWRAGLWDFPEKTPRVDLVENCVKLGTVETRYVVTRHRVRRQTEVWRVESPKLRAAESVEGAEYRWVSATEPEVAVGSPLRKAIAAILAEFS